MFQRKLRFGVAILTAALLAGCAATPAQQAMDYRRTFDAALESMHQLHLQGKVSAKTEQQLLPVIQAGSAALDQMDADAAAGNQAGFDVALTALQAAIAQLNTTASSATQPATQPSTSH